MGIDIKNTVEEYLDRTDWRIQANSNQGYSIGGLILNTAGKVTANYWLDNVFSKAANEAHREGRIHIHDLDFLGGYCAGWSLRRLLEEGFNGVSGRVASAPPKHLSSACGQIVNFLGTMQNEWAGAQAFSSFDTYMAPFIREDNLNLAQVKQSLQEMVFSLNVSSRWGCVDTDTEVLSTTGWKHYFELEQGDEIYTWKDGTLEVNRVNKVVVKPFKGKLHSYKGKGYHQLVTPNHRVLVCTTRGERIKLSEEIFGNEQLNLPTRFKSSALSGSFLDDTTIRYAAMIYANAKITNGQIEVSKPKKHLSHRFVFDKERNDSMFRLIGGTREYIASEFFNLNQSQAKLFIKTWMQFNGNPEKFTLNFETESVGDDLQYICLLAGYTTYRGDGFVKCRKSSKIGDLKFREVKYEGDVWCPNVDNGTAVFRKDGTVFISGQTQSPFTNLTFDWTCPDDLKEQNPIIGGVTKDYTYGELSKEMDMINRAFLEIMLEGDANGRAFTFPIPTYNITPSFDWNSENADLLFEMTSKYGLPYFQNFLNSELHPSDIRSMCPLSADTKILAKSSVGIRVLNIKEIVRAAKSSKNTAYQVWNGKEWCEATPIENEETKVLELTLSNGSKVKMGINHLQPVVGKGDIKASEIKVGDELPLNSAPIEFSGLGDKALGQAIGAYCKCGTPKENGIIYQTFDKELRESLSITWQRMGFAVSEQKSGLKIEAGSSTIVARFVSGFANKRHLEPKTFNASNEFKSALLTAWAEQGEISSPSAQLIKDGITLCVLLGLDYSVKDDMLKVGKKAKSVTVEKIETLAPEPLYCLEVKEKSHLFALANGLITHNCRLQLDLRELEKRGNGLFGSAEQTGSIGVVTINLARLGYLHKGNFEGLLAELDSLIDISADTLQRRRAFVSEALERGLYPYTARYLPNLNNHFSTIGVNGGNEMIRNFSRDEYDITSPQGEKLAEDVLNHIRTRLTELQEKTGTMFNLEATPAEGATYRFAKTDKQNFPDIIQAGTEQNPYYTNSTQLPVDWTDDMFLAQEHQEPLQTKYTGGTVMHLYVGSRINDVEIAKSIVKRSLETWRTPYLTITPTFSICPNHGYIAGEQETCPTCLSRTEIWTRVMGYFRPKQSFNIGKVGEFEQRVTFAHA